MIDVNATLRTFLIDDTANPAINALVADRIYINRLADSPTRPCIRIIPTDGESALHSPILERSFKMQCYGNDEVEAINVSGALFDALHGVTNNSTFNIRAAWQDGGENIFNDPETEWPFVDTDYTVMFFNT